MREARFSLQNMKGEKLQCIMSQPRLRPYSWQSALYSLRRAFLVVTIVIVFKSERKDRPYRSRAGPNRLLDHDVDVADGLRTVAELSLDRDVFALANHEALALARLDEDRQYLVGSLTAILYQDLTDKVVERALRLTSGHEVAVIVSVGLDGFRTKERLYRQCAKRSLERRIEYVRTLDGFVAVSGDCELGASDERRCAHSKAFRVFGFLESLVFVKCHSV